MTDITDPQAQFLTAFARGVAAHPGSYSDDLVESAKAVLATVDDPASTLVGELRGWERIFRDEGRHVDATSMRDLAARAEQIEQERDELSSELTRTQGDLSDANDLYDQMETEWSETQRERDEARAEVERLTAEQVYWKEYALERQRVVERLVAGGNAATIASEANVAPDQQANPAPADVPPGQPWLVKVGVKRGLWIGLRIDPADKDAPWYVLRLDDGRVDDWVSDSRITLVSRLVPAPRVITDPDELDKLAATSIIRDGRGWPGGITDQGVTMINGFCLSDEEVLAHGPVTVLWEAGA